MNTKPKNRLATDNDSAAQRPGHQKVGIAGCHGRVGKLLVKELLSRHYHDLSLSAGSVREGYESDGKDIGEILGQPPIGIKATSDPVKLFEASDIVIDFTTPENTAQNIWIAAKQKKPIIIGTTGLNAAQEKEIEDASKETAIIYAANMSVGVNLLIALVEQAASRLGAGWDIEISETHHKHKVDAPSGTALALGQGAAVGRNVNLDDVALYAREGHTGEREDGTIGFATLRGGDVVGEHTVNFFGAGERLELSHKATDRSLFAKGALQAASWAAGKAPGLYSMRDVLGL